MPIYKRSLGLQKVEDILFDRVFPPGTITPYSGIYRCEACGFEVTSINRAPSSAHLFVAKDTGLPIRLEMGDPQDKGAIEDGLHAACSACCD